MATATPNPAQIAARPTGAPAPAGGPPGGVTIDPIRLLKQYFWWLAASGVVGIVLGVAAFFLLRQFAPRWDSTVYFEASAPLEGADDMGLGTTQGSGGEAEMELFMLTQVALMVSPNILAEATRRPEIQQDTRWARQFVSGGTGGFNEIEAALALAEIVNARVQPDTTFMLLSASTPRKEDAAIIANALAETYLEFIQRDAGRKTTEQIEVLTRQIQRADSDRQGIEARATRLLADNSLTGLENRQSQAQQEIATLTPQLTMLRTELQSSLDRLRMFQDMLTRPGGVDYPELIRQEVSQDPIVARHEQIISTYTTQKRALLEDFGPNHVQVRRIESQIRAEEIERERDRERLMSERFGALIELTRQAAQDLQVRIRETDEQLRAATQQAATITRILAEYNTLKGDAERKAIEKANLEESLNDVQATIERAASQRVSIRFRAQTPDKIAFPKIIIIVPVVTVLTVFLVTGLILLREATEQRVRMPSDVAMIPRTKVLGVVPDISQDPAGPKSIEDVMVACPDGVIAEQIRQIRGTIRKNLGSEASRSFLFTAGLPGAGTSSIVANLGRSTAANGVRTLIIDGNMRRPRQHELMGIKEGPGLGEVLAGEASLESAVQPTKMENLFVLSAGSPKSRQYERVNTEEMTRLIEEAKRHYQVVAIDSPPMTVATDAIAYANRADVSIIVTRAYLETRGLLGRIRNQLGDCRAEFLGVIVNGVKASAGGYFKKNFRIHHQYHDAGGKK